MGRAVALPPRPSAARGEAEEAPLPFTLNRLMAAWNARLEGRLGAVGATFAQWRVLLVAARTEAPLMIAELSERTMVAHSTLSRQLTAMERAGLAARRAAAGDGRAVEIRLTARGLARYREVLPLAEAETAAGLEGLSAREVEELRRLLGRVAGNVGIA